MMHELMVLLRKEQADGDQHGQEIVERIDAHIRDLEIMRAWVLDSFKVRCDTLDRIINGDAPAPKLVPSPKEQDNADLAA